MKKTFAICSTIILILQIILTSITYKTYSNKRISYSANKTLVSVAQEFSSWRQKYGSAYEGDETTGGAGHGSVADLKNRIAHHFTPGYGVNCSGFVRAVIYHATGIDVLEKGNIIYDIVHSGYFTEISEAEIQPGDIFYEYAGPEGHHISIITEVIGHDENGTATFRTAESDNGDWTRIMNRYDIYPGATAYYNFLRLNYNDNVEYILKWAMDTANQSFVYQGSDPCKIISDSLSDEIEDLFYYICIGGILLVVILSIIDLIKVVSGNSEDGLINFFKNLKARIITIIILLILPVIIPYILNLINSLAEITGYNSDNPLCLKK